MLRCFLFGINFFLTLVLNFSIKYFVCSGVKKINVCPDARFVINYFLLFYSKQHNHSSKSLLSPTKSLTNTPSLSTKKIKHSKEKRRSSKSETVTSPISNSSAQWYTVDDVANGIPIFELTQEVSNCFVDFLVATQINFQLTSKRPLRSEVEKEKRLSRPSSGQFSRPNSLSSIVIRGPNSSGNSSNRDSIG